MNYPHQTTDQKLVLVCAAAATGQGQGQGQKLLTKMQFTPSPHDKNFYISKQ
jgi:hypothetical protein